MPKDISLRQLRYFIAAAETGQLSMAAKKVHVAQSTVTNAILQLEDSLGVKLFERHPQGVTLTAEGYNFFHRAKHIHENLEVAISAPHFQRHQLAGSIRMAASYALLGYFLPPLMARFRQQYPEIDLDLIDMERPQIEEGVLSGDLELGLILLSNSTRRNEFDHHVLLRSRRQLWTSAHHPLSEQPHATLQDIAAYPYIQLTVEEGEESTRRYWQQQGMQPDIAFRTSSMEAVRGLVAHGFGITLLADMVYRPWSLEGSKIEAIPVLGVVPHLESGMIWRKGRALDKPADAFRQFLIHSCGS
ncbi:MAG: LysR family transcriptional regulator [Thiolinea sp.]